MKLTVIGGGGVRSPLFVASALNRAGRIHLDELCLMDNNPEKLEVFGALSRVAAKRLGSPVRIVTTTDPQEALEGANYIVTSIRVGDEPGRVLDERIALRHGVLGQETTGPGGFAMAMRSIPAIIDYAELAQKLCPQAWMFNFTNPAGLVAQALQARGFERTIGICDGANQAQHAVAQWLNIPSNRLRPAVFGLNHLSWVGEILLDGEEVLQPLLKNPEFLAGTALNVFDPELVEMFGMWLNEYLYYYYYAEKAMQAIQSEERTRGEEIVELNRRLMSQLRAVNPAAHPDKALDVYVAYNRRRGATYMHYARSDAPTPELADEEADRNQPQTFSVEEGEGYAGVALDIIQGLEGSEPVYTALNVPNRGAIAGMADDDVVEVSCVVDSQGVRPLPIGPIPRSPQLLMQSVKRYERLAVEAILERSRRKAILALMAHPLVLSYSRATLLVDEYLAAHREFVGEWR